MSAKQSFDNQHVPLHQLWPGNCCLCNCEERIKKLEEENIKLKNILETTHTRDYKPTL